MLDCSCFNCKHCPSIPSKVARSFGRDEVVAICSENLDMEIPWTHRDAVICGLWEDKSDGYSENIFELIAKMEE